MNNFFDVLMFDLCDHIFTRVFCFFPAGAPPLRDGDLSGRGVYPGPRGPRGGPGLPLGDARPGGGTFCRVRQSTQYIFNSVLIIL